MVLKRLSGVVSVLVAFLVFMSCATMPVEASDSGETETEEAVNSTEERETAGTEEQGEESATGDASQSTEDSIDTAIIDGRWEQVVDHVDGDTEIQVFQFYRYSRDKGLNWFVYEPEKYDRRRGFGRVTVDFVWDTSTSGTFTIDKDGNLLNAPATMSFEIIEKNEDRFLLLEKAGEEGIMFASGRYVFAEEPLH